jgi:hypothetical protein
MTESALRADARRLLDSRYEVYGWGHGPTDVDRTMTGLEAETQAPGLGEARRALRAIVYNWFFVESMRQNDPMLLRQLAAALPEFEGMPVEKIAPVYP